MRYQLLIFLMVYGMLLTAQDEDLGQTSKKCPQCQYVEKRDMANFCIHCGTKLVQIKTVAVVVCTECSRPLDKGANFCAFCGKKGKTVYQPAPDNESYEPDFDKTGSKPIIPPKKSPGEKIPGADIAKTENPENGVLAQFSYPGATLLEDQVVQEGLPHTSQKRSIVRKLFNCPVSPDEMETFYRSRHPKMGIMKVTHYDILTLLQMKIDAQKYQVEIQLLSFTPIQSLTVWENKHRQVKSRLELEAKPLNDIDKEIGILEDYCKQGKVTAAQIEPKLADLRRNREIAASSVSYWSHVLMERVMAKKQNLLMITLVTKK